jgi:elongator complex protein 1
LFTCNGQYIKYKLAMTTHFCSPALDYNASIAVIDGLNVLITPLKKTIIPPPMSLLKVVCTSPVNKIAWSSYNMDILIYCMTGELFYHKYTNNNQVDSYIPFEVRYHIKGLKNYSGSVQHILWTDINELVVIADVVDNDLNLVSFKFESNKDKDKTFELTEKNRIKLNFPVLNVSYNRAAKKIAIQYSSGFVIKYDSELNYLDEFHFPQPCPTFELISAVDSNNKLQDIYIGLTQYYRLYVNKFEIANNCNSFYIHDEFLLFTDHLNTLKFVHLQRMSKNNIFELN